MDLKILQDVSASERKEVLRNSADKKEVFTYPKTLDAKEVTHLKDEYTKNAIALAKHEEAKKEFNEDFKAKVKPLKLEMSSQMTRIRSKVEEITEDVYLISDQENELMCYYNALGELVYHRPLMPEEKQLTLVDKTKLTGTNN
ncbi:hypothetical protein [Mesoflavibacter profundi]|uniref:hypothetical protein n=1 Tax=Mesoflavibacter profundi TaxID=2708110 RepID=UPI00351490DD